MSKSTIKGVYFYRNYFSDLSRDKFSTLKGHFGVYVFCDEEYNALYVGESGDKPDQKQDLCDRIQQYFTKNNSGVSFPRRWMKRNKTQCYSCFLRFAHGCELLTLSTDEKSDHAIEIIKGIEEFLIRELDPPYNFKYCDLLRPMEQTDILGNLFGDI